MGPAEPSWLHQQAQGASISIIIWGESISHSVVFDFLKPHGLSVGLSRQEYWSGLPFPSPGDLPNPGIEPESPALQVDTLPSEQPGSLMSRSIYCKCLLQSDFLKATLAFSGFSFILVQNTEGLWQVKPAWKCSVVVRVQRLWFQPPACH